MTTTFLRRFQVTHGAMNELAPESEEDLYTTPSELERLYGCALDEPSIRAAMNEIHAWCHRPSLWPCEYQDGDKRLSPDCQEVMLDVTPVIEITAAAGKYGIGRRDRQGWGSYNYGLVASYLTLQGGSPQWINLDPAQLQLDRNTGKVWVGSGIIFAPWAVVRLTYIAGVVTIPDYIKKAILEIAMATKARGGQSDRTKYTVGRVSRTFTTDSYITPTVARLLQPFRVHSYY